MSSPKLKQLRVLLLEDSEGWFDPQIEAIKLQFLEQFDNKMYELNIIHAAYLADIPKKALTQHFHFLSIDLRMPMYPGGTMDYRTGLDEIVRLPISSTCLGAVLTAFSQKHPAKAKLAGRRSFEFWVKAAADRNLDVDAPILDAPDWAKFVLFRLQEYGPSTHFQLECLKQKLPHAIASACNSVQASCIPYLWYEEVQPENPLNTVQRQVLLEAKNRRDIDKDSLIQACRLGEFCKEWVFSSLAGLLNSAQALPTSVQKFAISGDIDNGIDKQQLKENLIHDMLIHLYRLSQDEDNKEFGEYDLQRLFSHLDIPLGIDLRQLEFVNALKTLRQKRNELAHQNIEPPFEEHWQEIAVPLRRVLDALSFFYSYGIVTQTRKLNSYSVHAERFEAQAKDAKTYDIEFVGNVPLVRAQVHVRQIYAFWPLAGGGMGLIPLSPWLHCWKLNAQAAVQAHFYAGRNVKGLPLGIEADTWRNVTADLQHSETLPWQKALDAVANQPLG